MQTLQPALKNGRFVWDRANMPVQEFEQRTEAIRECMRRENIDLLLAYGHAYDFYGYPCYIGNHIIRLAAGELVLMDQSGRVVLFFEGASRGIPSVQTVTWVKDLVPAGEIAKSVADYLAKNQMDPKTVGLAGVEGLMPHGQHEALLQALAGKRVVDAGPILDDLRKSKSPAELGQMQRAGRLIKDVLNKVPRFELQGRTDRELEARLFRECRLEGAEDVRVLMGWPQNADWSMRPSQNTPISAGQTVIVYLTAAFERYWAEAIRTYVVGAEGQEEKGQAACGELFEELVGQIKPGRSAADCYQAVTHEIRLSGLAAIDDYGLLQGVGMSRDEAPRFSETSGDIIAPGDCLSLRLAFKHERLGAVMFGQTLAVRENRIEILTGD